LRPCVPVATLVDPPSSSSRRSASRRPSKCGPLMGRAPRWCGLPMHLGRQPMLGPAIEPLSDRSTQRSNHPAGERSTGAPGPDRARFGIGFYRRLAQAVAHSLTRRAPQPRDVSAARPTGCPADGTPTGWVGHAAPGRRGAAWSMGGPARRIEPRRGDGCRRSGAGASDTIPDDVHARPP